MVLCVVLLGADLADEVEAKVTAFGRWLLEAVFANDAGAALDDRTHNPVWLELVRRAGGPTLRVSSKVLYVALLSETGEAPKVRITAPVLMSRMKKMREALGGAAVIKKVRALQTELDAAERQALAGEIDKVRDVLSAIAREVRGR